MNLKTAKQGKSEKIAVTATAGGLTPAKYKLNPESYIGAGQAFITFEDQVRFTVDGTTPVEATKIGHPWPAQTPLILEGQANIQAFRVVRSSATTDTTLFVTYF